MHASLQLVIAQLVAPQVAYVVDLVVGVVEVEPRSVDTDHDAVGNGRLVQIVGVAYRDTNAVVAFQLRESLLFHGVVACADVQIRSTRQINRTILCAFLL